MKKIVVLLTLCIFSFPLFATDVLQCGSDTVSLVVEPDEEQLRQQCDSLEIARERLKREEEARMKQEKAIRLLQEGLFGQSENDIASKPSFTNPPEVTMPVRQCLMLVKPQGIFPQSGEVVLKITVDEEGDVIGASVGLGTTISDQQTIQAAKKAAMATKFSRGEIATGTITYIFK